MTTDRGVRAGRAAVFAAVCVLLAAVGHVVMSGTALPWWVLCGAFAVTGAATWPLTGRERGVGAVTVAATLVQTALHTAFSWSQALTAGPGPGTAGHGSPSFAQQWASYLLCGEAGTTLSESRSVRLVTRAGLGGQLDGPPPGGLGGHGAHAGHATADMTGAADMAGGAAHHGMSSSGMLAAHLLAALLAGLWLAHGERAVFRLGRACGSVLLAPLRWSAGRPVVHAPAPADPPPRRTRRDHEVPGPRPLLLVHVITSRGPPCGTAVV
ncbi:hypothetical protein GCM10009801_44010 [Streptomyces albiaxialis]|uniref:Integral membrane protein n=1 Tax=Streptomyces albiaxialis TaxID=329523 RepID=A0ABN2W5I1_9ACTN